MIPALIFLDIDGVLAHDGSDGRLDARCIERLDRLVSRARAEIVLVSSWRDTFGLLETQRRLARAGFRGRLSAAAPALRTSTRSAEIVKFLADLGERPPFVILDDVPVDRRLARHQVLVDELVGLTDADTERAHEIVVRCRPRQ